jgi:cation transport ATPase
MDIIDALTSAAIIVLVVTIGKHFENKVKKRIERITEQIFPESVLFENMRIEYVEIRNRQLMIVQQKVYDVSLIEKNDIIKVGKGRVLVDLILISGKVKAVQSARTGCEDVVELTKGERLESGAIVNEEEGALAIVENVLEKSLLIEIGTQIKMAQNQE